MHTLDFNFFCKIFGFFVIHHAVFSEGVVRGYLKKQKTALGNIAGSGLEVVYEQTDTSDLRPHECQRIQPAHGTKQGGRAVCQRMAYGALAGNRPIISRNGVMPDFLRLLNQRGREINTVARAFNSGYGTAEELRQALDCLKDIAQAAYEIRKEGFTHAP